MTNVDRAWIWGVTPRRTAAKMNNGRVWDSGPAVKKLITKSSSESVKASMPPAIMPGMSSGSMTLRRRYQLLAKRSRAASSTSRPMATRRLRTTSATKAS